MILSLIAIALLLLIIIALLARLEHKMATSQAQFDTELAALQLVITNGQAALASVLTLVSNDVTELLAKVAGGATPVDLTNELTQVQANVASISAAIAAAQTAGSTIDAEVNPPAPPAT